MKASPYDTITSNYYVQINIYSLHYEISYCALLHATLELLSQLHVLKKLQDVRMVLFNYRIFFVRKAHLGQSELVRRTQTNGSE